MMLKYERITLKSRVNTWLGTLFLATVALWATQIVWGAATGEDAIVKAFTTIVQEQTVLPD